MVKCLETENSQLNISVAELSQEVTKLRDTTDTLHAQKADLQLQVKQGLAIIEELRKNSVEWIVRSELSESALSQMVRPY